MLVQPDGTIVCTKRFSFDAAHRVLEHESKCKHLHGHRWDIEVTCQASHLDNLGRVIDFGQLKAVFAKWLDENLDHNIILNREDPLLNLKEDDEIWMGKKPYILPFNPTAEHLAMHLFLVGTNLLKPFQVWISRIRVYETPNSYAEFTSNHHSAAD